MVVITDMDMPKNCFECDKTYKCKKDGKVQCPHINMPSISSNMDCRPPYCPLKEVSDNSVLEDIKVEIELLPTSTCTETHRIGIGADDFKENVLEILDKYIVESGG